MWPLLRDGDFVDLEIVPADAIRPGDIIAFASGDIILLHRVIALDRRDGILIREKGDNTRVSTRLSGDQLLGRAVTRWRQGLACRLLAPPGPALALLTWGSRMEGNFFEALRGVRRAVLPARPEEQATLAGRLVSRILSPLRLPGLLLLQHLYRTESESGSAELDAWTIEAYRALTSRGAVPLPPVGALNPEAALRRLDAHGLQALAQEYGAKNHPEASWEPAAREALRQARYRAGFVHLVAAATLQDVVRALAAENIDSLVLKGPPLSWELYGDGALRPSTDIDLLVRRSELEHALRALEAAGYRARGKAWQQAAVRRGHFHIVLEGERKGRVPVELHWDLVDRANLYRIETASVFKTARRVTMPEGEVAVLGVEEGLVYLCLHLAKHALFNRAAVARGQPAAWFARPTSGNRLIWFADLDRYLRAHAGTLSTERLVACMKAWNVREDVVCNLQVLGRLDPGGPANLLLDALGEARPVADDAAPRRESPWRERWMASLLRPDEGLVIRPARLLTLGPLLLPSPSRILGYYGRTSAWALPWLYVRHPFHMGRKLLAG
jgi:hypothetical protein